jgi:hypothetical protein
VVGAEHIKGDAVGGLPRHHHKGVVGV